MKLEPLENEKWVRVKDESQKYLVSNYGRVWSNVTNQFLKGGHKGEDGHHQVTFSFKSTSDEQKYLHRLVAEKFVEIPEIYRDIPINDLVVHHIDENPHNNRADNLVWLTTTDHTRLHWCGRHHSEETKDKLREIKTGKHHSEETKKKLSIVGKGKKRSEETKKRMSESKKGNKAPWYGKFNGEHLNAKPINQYTQDGVLIKTWSCAAEAHNELGISKAALCHCLKGGTKTSMGFKWTYA